MTSTTIPTEIQWDREIISLDDSDIIFCLYTLNKAEYSTEFVWAVLSKDGSYRGIKRSRLVPTNVRILNTIHRPTSAMITPLFNDPIECIMASKPLIRRSDLEALKVDEQKDSQHD